jgi:processing peptidase subunit beta
VPSHVLSLPGTRVSTLSNGIRVATESHGSAATATIGVWLDAGSAYETSANNGTAHFLEHMLFKGTQRRSKTDIELGTEQLGNHLNAYTSREQTAYYSQGRTTYAAEMLDLIGDMVTSSSLDEAAIAAERSVILQEKEFVESNFEEVIFDYLHGAAYQGSSLGATILGTNANITKGIDQNALSTYRSSFYTPDRMVIASVGGLEHDAVVEMANKSFGHLQAPSSPSAPLAPPPFTGAEIRLRDDALPVAHVTVAAETPGWTSPDYFTFMVLSYLYGAYGRGAPVGTNAGARLAEMMAKESTVDSYSAFHIVYNDTGLFGTYFVAPHETLDNAAYYCISEWVRIANSATDAEVERAKRMALSSLLTFSDSTSTACDELGRQMIALGRRIPPAEFHARLAAVTTADVKHVARKYLTEADLAVAAIGPVGNLPTYDALQSWASGFT